MEVRFLSTAPLSKIGEEIEFDDGMWEIDDARKEGDNREFDLKLDPKTYKIVLEREDR